MKNRESNFELARIISMMMIIGFTLSECRYGRGAWKRRIWQYKLLSCTFI